LVDISLDAEGKRPLGLGSVTGTDTSASTSTDSGENAPNLSKVQTYQSSENVTRSFCSVCGAIVFFALSERDQNSATMLLDVAIGLLDAPEGARAESWLEWWTKRLSFREDAVGRADSLVEGMEKGLREFGERQRPQGD
jgi:hypothetical protein